MAKSYFSLMVRKLLMVPRLPLAVGLMSHWNLFEQRVLLPIRKGMEPPTLDELAKDTEAPTEKISSMLHTVKRKFRKSLRDAVAETLGNPEDVEVELSLLREHLSIGG